MEEAARERQQRLAALRAGQATTPLTPAAKPPSAAETPDDGDKSHHPSPRPGASTLEEQAQQLLEEAQTLGEEPRPLEIAELAPKKANWDLKEGLEPKLAQLEEQTDAAIKELVRQRLRGGE